VRFKLRERRAQRVEPRRTRISVAFDGATDCRCYRGELGVGEVNCRHVNACPCVADQAARQ
jgi:hypothetical protein